LAVGSWQLAVGSQRHQSTNQQKVGSWQLAVGSQRHQSTNQSTNQQKIGSWQSAACPAVADWQSKTPLKQLTN